MSKQIVICILIVCLYALPNAFARAEVGLLTRHHQSLSFDSGKKTEVKPQMKGIVRDQTTDNSDEPKQAVRAETKEDASNQPVNISCEYVEADNAYRLIVTGVSGGGVVLQEKLLEQAPVEGYAAAVEIRIPIASKAYDLKKYIYTKSYAGPESEQFQYAQVELDMAVGIAKLIMDVNAVANPGGSRQLKYDHKVQQKLIAKRVKEIEDAIGTKTATEKDMLEMRDLQVMEQAGTQNRWDFSGNRRREMKDRRNRHLEADGFVRPKKIRQEQSSTSK